MADWTVLFHPAAEADLGTLPATERVAILNAVAKLQAIGPDLGFPHTSSVLGADEELRELRPRQGRSPWRAFYRKVGGVIVVAAVGPEASNDRRGFGRAVAAATGRLNDLEAEVVDSDTPGTPVHRPDGDEF